MNVETKFPIVLRILFDFGDKDILLTPVNIYFYISKLCFLVLYAVIIAFCIFFSSVLDIFMHKYNYGIL